MSKKINHVSPNMTTDNSKPEKYVSKEKIDRKFCEAILSLSPLISAKKIGEMTSQFNFDWENSTQVSYKVEEEWQELKKEIVLNTQNKESTQEELGDLLFSIAQLARHLNIDPELALTRANHKFINRFNNMITLINRDKKNIEDMNQSQIDSYWRIVKKSER